MIERLKLSAKKIRLRLTLWYLALLTIALLLSAGYIYFHVQKTLFAQVDSGLQLAATQALSNIENENGLPAFQNNEQSQMALREFNRAGFAIRILGMEGTVAGGLGDYAGLPPTPPLRNGFATILKVGEPWRVYSQMIESPDSQAVGWLQSAQTLDPILETLENLRGQLLLGLPLVLITAGLGGLFLADRALRPIDRVTKTAEAIGGSDLSTRIHYDGPDDELGRLARTFDGMLDRLQAAFERERRFTADASHELRTPLTALKGRIGVTLSRPRQRAEYEGTLRDLEREVDRLIRLSQDLLFLARLDQGSFAFRPEKLDLRRLLIATVEQFQPIATTKSVDITMDIPEDLAVWGSPDHLIRLFLNLLDNAVHYTPEGGQIFVRAGGDSGESRIYVQDTGPGIPAKHLRHVFERFYRAQSGRSRDDGGAGLGLAIAYEIARSHGGRLEVESEMGKGTTFIVHLLVRKPMDAPA